MQDHIESVHFVYFSYYRLYILKTHIDLHIQMSETSLENILFLLYINRAS